MNRSTRTALTGGLVLAAALTVGGVALAGEDAVPEPAPTFVTVQDPAPGAPSADRDCPEEGGGTGGGAGAPQEAPTSGGNL